MATDSRAPRPDTERGESPPGPGKSDRPLETCEDRVRPRDSGTAGACSGTSGARHGDSAVSHVRGAPSVLSGVQRDAAASLQPGDVIDLTESEAEPQTHLDSDGESAGSGPDDVLVLHATTGDSHVPQVNVDTPPEKTNAVEEESEPHTDEERRLLPQEITRVTEVQNGELQVREGSEGHEGLEAKERKSRLECRECGKRFTRRETFNLHRHFHAHQDELASLTCKECGLTFQHRSSLIKHRSEHKQKGALAGVEKQDGGRDDQSLQCKLCAHAFPTLAKLRCHSCQRAPEKTYRCPLCRQDFQYRVSVNAHMRAHSLDRPLRCLECNKGFSCGLSLRIHQRSHAALKPFECPECGMVFRHRSVMEHHRRWHKRRHLHQCSVCGKHFRYGAVLQQHRFLHTGQKPFRCPDCGETFAFAQNMRVHWRQHHKRTHDCARCPLTFPDLAALQGHMVTHRREERSTVALSADTDVDELQRVHTCPLCPLTLPNLPSFKAHILTHEAEKKIGRYSRGRVEPSEGQNSVYMCPHCSLTCADLVSLQMHVLSHKTTLNQGLAVLGPVTVNSGGDARVGNWADLFNRKVFRCTECGKTFRHRSVLELHMRIHSKDKPFQCRVCGKSFKFSSYLQQHLIIHTGQKPFKCPDCGKDFAFLQNMKTHQRLHKQKPYRCTQCRKGYSEEGELKRHMMSHTGDKPHKCQLCDKSFGLAYLLRDHLNTHTGERPHRCVECHKSFPWLSSLLVHQKIHARKRQGLGQTFSLSLAPQRGRGRGRGTRSRRGDQWSSGWPRWAVAEGVSVSAHPQLFPGHVSEGQQYSNRISEPQAFFEPHSESRRQWRQQHWQSEAGGKHIHAQPQPHTPGWMNVPSSAQMEQVAVERDDSTFRQANKTSPWGPHAPLRPPQNLTPPDKAVDGKQQKDQQPTLGLTGVPPSTASQTAAQYEDAQLLHAAGPTAWGFRNRPLASLNTVEKNGNGENQQVRTRWSQASSSAPRCQPLVQFHQCHPWRAEKTSMWGFQAVPVQTQTHCSGEKLEAGKTQQHQSLGWVSTPMSTEGSPAAVSCQEEHPRKGEGPTAWLLSTPSALPQALSKPTCRKQQQPVVTEHQAPLKVTTSFPIAPSQNIYVPQGTVVSEEHVSAQTVKRPEHSHPNSSHPTATLTFAPNPLLQCMICGRSMPRELDLHIHYMQHAQGEI